MADPMKIRSPQMDTAIRMLTDGTFSKATGRKVPAFSLEQAAALVGNAMHETGSPNLSNMDVVERGNGGAGRGLMQYTGPRREAYDRANPGNDMSRQMQYAAQEYAGKHDPGGNSLIGYTRSLETTPRRDVTAATTHLLNNYFRPSDPEASRKERVANAKAVLKIYQGLTKPKPKPKAKQQQPNMLSNVLKIFGFAR
jgi:hypothetical protein